jgi:hypothetical protein
MLRFKLLRNMVMHDSYRVNHEAPFLRQLLKEVKSYAIDHCKSARNHKPH